jgi:hypothetical protein
MLELRFSRSRAVDLGDMISGFVGVGFLAYRRKAAGVSYRLISPPNLPNQAAEQRLFVVAENDRVILDSDFQVRGKR